MLLDLSQKCGLTGAPKKDIAINYSLTPTISILGFPFSFTINNAARFPCPIDVSTHSLHWIILGAHCLFYAGGVVAREQWDSTQKILNAR